MSVMEVAKIEKATGLTIKILSELFNEKSRGKNICVVGWNLLADDAQVTSFYGVPVCAGNVPARHRGWARGSIQYNDLT